jgi:hypothetical protein
VQKETPCGECTQGWIDGRGAVDGVNPIDLLKRKEQAALGAGGSTGPKATPTEPPPPEP